MQYSKEQYKKVELILQYIVGSERINLTDITQNAFNNELAVLFFENDEYGWEGTQLVEWTDLSGIIKQPDISSTLKLTQTEVFALGNAYGSFSVGDLDQGIHCVLPVKDSDTGKKSNEVFQSLFDEHIDKLNEGPGDGDRYLEAIRTWTHEHNIDVGLGSY